MRYRLREDIRVTAQKLDSYVTLTWKRKLSLPLIQNCI